VRVESRSQLQEAEVILQTFRHQIRADLRKQVMKGDLAAESISVLRLGLEGVRAAVQESLSKTNV
jgi:hypothetical protein